MMYRRVFLVLVSSTVFLVAAKCDSEKSKRSADDPRSVCDHMFEHCGDGLYDDKDQCTEDLEENYEECRLECILDTTDCELVHDCLYYGFNDQHVSKYCSGGSGGGSGGDDTETMTTDECAAEYCSSENSTCEQNSDCVAIFEICYSPCNAGDMECVAACAVDYLSGVEAHDALIACLQLNCE